MSTTLPLFWHLSSASKKERLDASVKLVSALEQFQAQFTPANVNGSGVVSKGEGLRSEEDLDDEDTEEDEESNKKSDGLDELNAQDVSYSIRRLVRGLASPRESSRLGFAVALTELLSKIQTITCLQIVTLILDGTKRQGSMSGQEERDMLFARLFGLTSVIQSGLFVRVGTLATSASTSSEVSSLESYKEVISQLVELGEKKAWLRESAWWSIALAVDALKDVELAWKDEAVEATLQALFVDHKSWCPEKVALAIKLQALYPKQDWKSLLAPVLKNSTVLSSQNLQALAKILKESGTEDDEEKGVHTASTGSWKPQLHFVWDAILDYLLPKEQTDLRTSQFQDFYRVVVDESLFANNSSPERKYWGFQVFQKTLKRVDQNSMPTLFTKNFMRSWINHLSNPDRYLHKIARQAAADVNVFVNDNPHLGFALISQLTGVNGSRQFDKLTKTKTVENILSSTTAEGVREYVDWLLQQIDQSESSEQSDMQAVNTRRAWIIEQFAALIRNGSVPKDDDWVKTILDWLVLHGLFQIKKKSSKSPFKPLRSVPKPVLSDDLRQSCHTRLLSCLGDLTAQTVVIKDGDKTIKATGVASDGEYWISKVISTITQLEADEKHVSLLVEAEDSDLQICAKAKALASRISNISGDQQGTAKGAQLLLNALLLQHYSVDEGEEVDLGIIEACIDAISRMFPERKSKKGKKSASKKEEPDDAPEPIDILVDTIIGLLEESTSYRRNIANQVFSLITPSMKGSTIDLVLSQLERRNPAELSADNDDEGEVDAMDEDEEEEEGSGDEKSDSENSEEGSEDGSELESDDDNDDEPVDLELRQKIEEALRVNGAAALSDESDDEEELMDDDQMMAIDEQLAAAFRARAGEKKGKNVDAQREATHFKNRVLDLVDIFLRKQPTNPFVLRFITPFIELVVGTSSDERQLSDKAEGIIRSRIGKAKEFPADDLTKEDVAELSKSLHIRAQKVQSSELLGLLSMCCIFLSKALQNLDGESLILDQYRHSLADFLTRKNSALNGQFFHDFSRKFPAAGWSLRGDVLEQAGKAVNTYRRCQAYQILETIISQLPSLQNHHAEAIQFMGTLQEHMTITVTQACEDKLGLSSSQIKDIFKLVLAAIRQTKRMLSNEPADTPLSEGPWDGDLWSPIAEKLGRSTRYKASPALRKMCEEVVKLSQKEGSSGRTPSKQEKVGAVKRKAEEVGGNEEEVSKKGKHKKHKKEKS